jgi:hypothetical protein
MRAAAAAAAPPCCRALERGKRGLEAGGLFNQATELREARVDLTADWCRAGRPSARESATASASLLVVKKHFAVIGRDLD